MKKRNALDSIQTLLKKPFFTAAEARELGVSPSLVDYYIKKGAVKRIRRGLYQSKNYRNPSLFQWEDLIEAVYSIPNGTVCLISALAIYELTDEIPRQHWIGIPHQTSAKKRRGTKIVRFRNMALGKTEIQLEGVQIPIFDRERTILDSFRLLSKEAAIKALKEAIATKTIDLIKLQDYAKKLRTNINPFLLTLTV